MIIGGMTPPISCPNCGQPVGIQARTCEFCGVDLALAALRAERELLPIRLPVEGAYTPEILVPRLGEYLVEKGDLTPVDLERGLVEHNRRAEMGHPVLLGQVLLELGLVSPKVLDQAITEQILQLQLALKRSNEELEARIRERTIELENAIEKLGELNQLKANFIANVSHELRTPLTHLKGYLDLLVEGELGSLSDSQMEVMKVMRRSEGRLEGLIEGLIQYSLVSSGKVNLELGDVDIVELIHPIITDVIQTKKYDGLTITAEVQSGLPEVRCDGEKIAWVISQLLDNACKFTPRGGQVKVVCRQANNFVKIAVTDTGIGIAPERIGEIYEPFHQLDGSSTRRYSGTGLGLALSQRILIAHETSFEVNSTLGEGSSFAFSLPVAKASVPIRS
jgi:signal transduction histidine kinase